MVEDSTAFSKLPLAVTHQTQRRFKPPSVFPPVLGGDLPFPCFTCLGKLSQTHQRLLGTPPGSAHPAAPSPRGSPNLRSPAGTPRVPRGETPGAR